MTGDRPGLAARIDAVDRRIDAALEAVRERPAVLAVFTTASHVGDFSLVWHAAGIARGVALRRPDQTVALAVALGVESLVVNQGVKRIFRRGRPTEAGDPRSPVRRPSTSSFPSGHASAGAFAATVLVGWDGPRSAPLWVGLAALVGSSRAVVRIHHPSDVIGGAVIGTALGLVARRVLAGVLRP